MHTCKVNAIRTYHVALPGVDNLAPFRVVDEWEGFLKLQNDLGWILVVRPSDPFAHPIKSVPVECIIYQASPEIAAMMPEIVKGAAFV